MGAALRLAEALRFDAAFRLPAVLRLDAAFFGAGLRFRAVLRRVADLALDLRFDRTAMGHRFAKWRGLPGAPGTKPVRYQPPAASASKPKTLKTRGLRSRL